MEWVVSCDGSAIAYSVSGQKVNSDAPALVLVHGTGGNHARWAPVLPLFEPYFQVYAIDRRGRGANRDDCDRPYSIDVEYQDIATLINSVHQSGAGMIYLLGHSFGSICALEATRFTPHVDRLILYEPPVSGLGVQVFPQGFLGRLDSMLAAGDRKGVVSAFLQEVVKLPPKEFEQFKQGDQWTAELAAAHTLPRELYAAVSYEFDEQYFNTMSTPTLLLCGSDSLPFFKVAAEMIEASLPYSQLKVLEGQQHMAMDTAPALFARAVIDFLE